MKLKILLSVGILSLIYIDVSGAQEASSSPEQKVQRLENELSKLTARVTELERNRNTFQHYFPVTYLTPGQPKDPNEPIAFCQSKGFELLIHTRVDPKGNLIVVCADPFPLNTLAVPLNH